MLILPAGHAEDQAITAVDLGEALLEGLQILGSVPIAVVRQIATKADGIDIGGIHGRYRCIQSLTRRTPSHVSIR